MLKFSSDKSKELCIFVEVFFQILLLKSSSMDTDSSFKRLLSVIVESRTPVLSITSSAPLWLLFCDFKLQLSCFQGGGSC